MTYYELQELAHKNWMKAQEKTDIIEYLYTHNRIDDDTKYTMFQEVRALQEQASKLEKQAVDAMINDWKAQYVEEIQREKEHQQQMYDERP